MPGPVGGFMSRFRRKTRPTASAGVHGVALHGGYIESQEKDKSLRGAERYRTYSDILANTSIVAAGTRFFLNLVAKVDWTFKPAKHARGEELAERLERAIMEDCATPWPRVVRRAAMHRFYGFSVQEWILKRHADGYLTVDDVEPRAQMTIERWDVDERGRVLGALQRSPQTHRELYLPRNKLVYLVDDTLADSPEGLGLFRHLVAPAKRLARYEQLEGIGFETDLRGIPVGRGPFTELRSMVEEGSLTEDERRMIEQPMRQFIEGHIKTHDLGLLLDSITYQKQDESAMPTAQKQWDIELLQGSSTSFQQNAMAIDRLNREIARLLGVEQLMLGSESVGSFALSNDKTSSFFLLVDATLKEVLYGFRDDLFRVLFELNGWPVEAMPEIGAAAVRHTDVGEIAGVLRDMATAGATLSPEDPVVNDIRELLGVSEGIVDEYNTMALPAVQEPPDTDTE